MVEVVEETKPIGGMSAAGNLRWMVHTRRDTPYIPLEAYNERRYNFLTLGYSSTLLNVATHIYTV